MTPVQTNTANISKGQIIMVGNDPIFTVVSIKGDSVRLEDVEDNKYGFKRRHTTTLAQIGKQYADGFYHTQA